MKVVNIGCNDGMDDCRQFVVENLAGVMEVHLVDPSPAALEQCRQNYRDIPQARFHHLAIVPQTTARVIVYTPQGEPCSQHASVSREHLSAHHHARLDEAEVPAMRLPDFLASLQIGKPDRLYIDTEGLDCQILLQLDFSMPTPDFIQFEKTHADGPFRHGPTYQACVQKLQAAGYRIVPTSYGNEAAVRL